MQPACDVGFPSDANDSSGQCSLSLSAACALLSPAHALFASHRKEVWAQLRSEALVALKRDLYAPMTAAEARLTLESRQLGVSRLRLIPKSKGTNGQRQPLTFMPSPCTAMLWLCVDKRRTASPAPKADPMSAKNTVRIASRASRILCI